jgi:protein phosphatase
MLPTSASATTRIALLYGSATSVGRVRSENQDASASALFDVHDDQAHGVPLGVFLVADGMGGEAHGELASRIAARTVAAEFMRNFALPLVVGPATRAIEDAPELGMEEPPAERLGRALAHAVEAANRQVRNLARKLEQTTGTTMTALAIYGARAAIAHVGDSRAYVLRGDRMVQLTDDHSVLARLQAMDHPLLSDPDVFVPRSMLYRSLGQEDDTGPDTLDFTLAPGDRFLICSDGLWDDLDPQVIAHTLAEATDPGDCGDALVALANDAGGSDNSTAVVIFARAIAEEDRDDETESADTTPLDARASAPAEEA